MYLRWRNFKSVAHLLIRLFGFVLHLWGFFMYSGHYVITYTICKFFHSMGCLSQLILSFDAQFILKSSDLIFFFLFLSVRSSILSQFQYYGSSQAAIKRKNKIKPCPDECDVYTPISQTGPMGAGMDQVRS